MTPLISEPFLNISHFLVSKRKCFLKRSPKIRGRRKILFYFLVPSPGLHIFTAVSIPILKVMIISVVVTRISEQTADQSINPFFSCCKVVRNLHIILCDQWLVQEERVLQDSTIEATDDTKVLPPLLLMLFSPGNLFWFKTKSQENVLQFNVVVSFAQKAHLQKNEMSF